MQEYFMKILKISVLLSLVIILAAGCSDKKSTKKKTTTSGTDTITTDPDVVNDGTTANCTKGIYRDGATRCYYSDIPRITLNGSGANATAIGPVLWSSRTKLPSTYSQNNFVSDATFSLRIKAQYPSSNATTSQGKICSSSMKNNFTRMKVYFMLRRSIDSITTYKEVTATVGSFSGKVYFDLPGGTTDPYILEVVGIETDHRCNAAYGSLTTSQKAACTAGTYWSDIPLAAGPTSCAAFDIEYATDNTYDLPNS